MAIIQWRGLQSQVTDKETLEVLKNIVQEMWEM